MEGSQLVEGARYGLRLVRRAGEPLVQVELLQKVGRKGHVKVRHLDGPTPGLEEYVRTRNLAPPWRERRAFLRDEERLRRLDELRRRRRDRAVVSAADTVIVSSGHPDAGVAEDGSLHMGLDSVRDILRRAGLGEDPAALHPAGFVDREGTVHLPLEAVEPVARAFAAAEPETVLMYIDDEEREWKARGYEAGERFWHDWLREHQGGFASSARSADGDDRGGPRCFGIRSAGARVRRTPDFLAH